VVAVAVVVVVVVAQEICFLQQVMMFIRIMPKLHVVVKALFQAICEEQAEHAIQGTVTKPPSKKAKGSTVTSESKDEPKMGK